MASTRICLQGLLQKAALLNIPKQIPHIRNGSYTSSPFLVDVGSVTTKYTVSQNPKEWQFVESILPRPLVPEPMQKESYPSGWKPQVESEYYVDKPYYIPRTRNHMMPVYLHIKSRGVQRLTVIRKVQGDIWKLEKELRPFIAEQIKPKPVRLHVNEFARKIVINGDHVNAVKYWLNERHY